MKRFSVLFLTGIVILSIVSTVFLFQSDTALAQVGAEDDYYSTFQGQYYSVPSPGLLDNDIGIGPLSVISNTQPAHGYVTVYSDGAFSYEASIYDGFVGVDTFTYTIQEGPLTDTATVSITVMNAPPETSDDEYSVLIGDVLHITAPGVLGNDFDPGGDTILVTQWESPSHGSLDWYPDGSFIYTPSTSGDEILNYEIEDDWGGIDTGTVYIEIVNDPPIVVDDFYGTFENTDLNMPALGVLANDSDPDGDDFEVTEWTQPLNGSVAMNADGSFIYTPDTGFVGIDSFDYTVEDDWGDTSSATVTVLVQLSTGPAAENVEIQVLQMKSHGNDVLIICASIDGTPIDFTIAGLEGANPANPGEPLVFEDITSYSSSLGLGIGLLRVEMQLPQQTDYAIYRITLEYDNEYETMIILNEKAQLWTN